MALAFWRDEYLTGDETVDAQHKQLFQIINNLTDAMLQRRGAEVLKQTLLDLYIYTDEHFLDEENLMFSRGYPDALEHRELHNELKVQLSVLIERYDRNFGPLAIEVSQFLTNWLIDHIKTHDAKVMRYLSTNSCRESRSLMV